MPNIKILIRLNIQYKHIWCIIILPIWCPLVFYHQAYNWISARLISVIFWMIRKSRCALVWISPSQCRCLLLRFGWWSPQVHGIYLPIHHKARLSLYLSICLRILKSTVIFHQWWSGYRSWKYHSTQMIRCLYHTISQLSQHKYEAFIHTLRMRCAQCTKIALLAKMAVLEKHPSFC